MRNEYRNLILQNIQHCMNVYADNIATTLPYMRKRIRVPYMLSACRSRYGSLQISISHHPNSRIMCLCDVAHTLPHRKRIKANEHTTTFNPNIFTTLASQHPCYACTTYIICYYILCQRRKIFEKGRLHDDDDIFVLYHHLVLALQYTVVRLTYRCIYSVVSCLLCIQVYMFIYDII